MTGTERTLPPAEEMVSVELQWHETVKYAKTVKMSRSDFDQMMDRWIGSERGARVVEEDLMRKFDLNRVEGYDWEDTEFDVIGEAGK